MRRKYKNRGADPEYWLVPIELDTPADESVTAGRRVLSFTRGLLGLVSVLLLCLLGRVVQLQMRPSDRIARLIDSQQSRRDVLARRGHLTDALGRPLAISRTATRLFADPRLIQDPTSFARIVSDMLALDAREVEKKIRQRRDRRYAVLEHRLAAWQVEELGNLKLPGLATQRWLVREYPQGHLAGHLVGVAGFEGRGLEGLEFAFKDDLAPTSGSLDYLRDVRFRPVRMVNRNLRPPRDGVSIGVTIDLTIQSIAETELSAQCRHFEAQQGQLIIIEPHTGRILAMANYPEFDPNNLDQTSREQRRNRCVTDVFEPGSVFKPFVWAKALEGGFLDPGEVIDCTTNGLWVSPEGRRIHDVRGHGLITAAQVITKSSNPGMAQIGLRLGAKRLHQAVGEFGFGSVTGSGLPGEATGIVHPLAKWNHYSVTSVPMGQEIAVTGLQLVRALSAIANDGLLPRPRVRSTEGILPVRHHVLSALSARYTRYVMRLAVLEGTGRKANSDLFSIFGKTGTAQVASSEKRGYLKNQYVASFIAGAPVAKPRIVVGCFIHRPNKAIGHYGGIVAAPAVKRVIEQTLVYLGVEPISDF